jgi:hypothetical protein
MPVVTPKRAKPPPPPADMMAPGAARADASTRQRLVLQPKDEYPKTLVDPAKPASSGSMLFLVLGGLVAVIGVGLAVLLWPPAAEVAPAVSLVVDAGVERAVEVPVVATPVEVEPTPAGAPRASTSRQALTSTSRSICAESVEPFVVLRFRHA